MPSGWDNLMAYLFLFSAMVNTWGDDLWANLQSSKVYKTMHLVMSIDDILFRHSYGKFMHVFDLISEKNKYSPFIYKNNLVAKI